VTAASGGHWGVPAAIQTVITMLMNAACGRRHSRMQQNTCTCMCKQSVLQPGIRTVCTVIVQAVMIVAMMGQARWSRLIDLLD
jgi:hypothetical protein